MQQVVSKFFICLITSSLPISLAAGTLQTIQTGHNPLIELPGPQKEGAQVRIAVELRPFEKILVQGRGEQKQQLEYRVIQPTKHMLRARIETSNHFYIGKWHIETVPVRWSRSERLLHMNVRIYKRYGDRQELEEFVGQIPISGTLDGENGLFVLTGQTQQRFHNKQGHPIVEMRVGEPLREKAAPPIARQAPRLPSQKQ